MKTAFGWLIVVVLIVLVVRPSFSQTQHGIDWTWTPVTMDTAGDTIVVDGYNIYCSTSASGPFTTKANSSLVTTPEYLETGLTVGTTYYCQVTASLGGIESAPSPTGSALFQFPPVAPGAPVAKVQ